MNAKQIKNMVMAAVLLAVGMVLPFLTAQIAQIGQKLSPLHIPVLLCGFVCGPWWGAAVGCILPILRSLIFGMPPFFPTAAAMAFELAAYGLMTGILYARLPKKPAYIYVALIGSMLFGRIVWGLASALLYTFTANAFTFQMFLAGAFINAAIGIAVHILIIPPIVLALQKSRLIQVEYKA